MTVVSKVLFYKGILRRATVFLVIFERNIFLPIVRLSLSAGQNYMASNLENMDCQSILDTEAISDDARNSTLSTIITVAMKDINSTMEKRYTEMEKMLNDSMLKAVSCEKGDEWKAKFKANKTARQ